VISYNIFLCAIVYLYSGEEITIALCLQIEVSVSHFCIQDS
jgi:hypothetical protein